MVQRPNCNFQLVVHTILSFLLLFFFQFFLSFCFISFWVKVINNRYITKNITPNSASIQVYLFFQKLQLTQLTWKQRTCMHSGALYRYVPIYSISKPSRSEGTHCPKSHSSMAPVGLSTKMFSSYKSICVIWTFSCMSCTYKTKVKKY